MPDFGETKDIYRQVLFNHPNTTVETDLIEHLLLKELIVHYFSFANLVKKTTIRTFSRIDGVTYTRLTSKVFPDDFEDGVTGVIITLDGISQDMKITLQSEVAEGSAKPIPGTVRDEIRI